MPFPIFDTQDAVPESIRSEYEEKDGKWHPKVPDVTNLNSALEAERTKAANEERARKKAEKDLADLKRKESAAEKGITDEQLQALRDEDATKRKPIEDENARLKAENDTLKRHDRVKALALSKEVGIMPDRIDDAMTLLEPRTTLTDAGTIAVKDKDGKPTTETIDAFLKTTFKAEKPWLYLGSGSNGSGAEGSSGGSGGNGSYDPVAAGKAAAKEQKKTQGENALAFK